MKLKVLLEVGLALRSNTSKPVIRAEYRSFQEYCRNRWEMSRVHAFRLLKAGGVHQLLLPVGNISLPENEAQIQPLTGLPTNKIKSIWQRAIKKAAPGRVTAKLVRLVISESEAPNTSPRRDQTSGDHQVARLLQKIRRQ
jgi:hypothetical protein